MFKAIFLQVATFANKFMVCLFFPASENFLKKKKFSVISTLKLKTNILVNTMICLTQNLRIK